MSHVRPERIAQLTALAQDGADEDALFELSCREMLAVLAELGRTAIVLAEVREMRELQRRYFKTRDGIVLGLARRAEARVDDALSPAPVLFPGGVTRG